MKSDQFTRGNAKPKTIYEFMKSRQGEDKVTEIVCSDKISSKRKIIENTLKCMCAAETVLQLILLSEKQKNKSNEETAKCIKNASDTLKISYQRRFLCFCAKWCVDFRGEIKKENLPVATSFFQS